MRVRDAMQTGVRARSLSRDVFSVRLFRRLAVWISSDDDRK